VGDRIVALLEDGWEERSTVEIAREVGCHLTTVQRWKRRWLGEQGREERKRCSRCGILGDEENPVGEEGLCLWCRVEEAGWCVRDWLEAGRPFDFASLGCARDRQGDGGGRRVTVD